MSLVSVTFEPNKNIQMIKKRARQIAKNNIIKKRTKKTEKKKEIPKLVRSKYKSFMR